MIHHRGDLEGNTDYASRAKRQRPAAAQSLVEEPPPASDCYKEVLEGHVNGNVRNSWLRNTSTLSAFVVHHDVSFPPHENLGTAIRSLEQQLLQAKRRLWPAAERCGRASGSESPQDEFSKARRLCNPMEPLGERRYRGLNQMFINRSAIKLANIDAILNFRLTSMLPSSNDPHFLFVDLCGAPGGFSEYIMKRLQSTRQEGSCRGYGMSLIGANEHGTGTPWKLNHIHQQHGNFQTVYRVSGGSDGTGDIYKWENVLELSRGIQHETRTAGLHHGKVHLVVADGGFDAQRDSECQEEMAQKLILCEMAAAISLLQVRGTFVLKMFGFQLPTVRHAMQSLMDMFEELMVLKPISSRPASSERYVVFAGFRGVPSDWDGPSWLNRVFLGRATMNPPDSYTALFRYLDQMDRDMLELNLKACFAILSCLERKTAAMETSSYYDSEDEEGPKVNVDMYKTAWRLH